MTDIIENVCNPNADQLWQQANTHANKLATERQRTNPLTPDAERKLYVRQRSDEYKLLKALQAERIKESRRKKSSAEQKLVQASIAQEEAQRKRVADAQKKVNGSLGSIRLNAAKQLAKVDDQLCITVPLVMAGLMPEAEETALLQERMRVEARQHIASLLTDRTRLDRAILAVAETVREQPTGIKIADEQAKPLGHI